MTGIADLIAREIIDSRGVPTIEVDCILQSGHIGRAAVPAGASTGRHEAKEVRDGDTRRYFGKGVRQAIDNVRKLILPRVRGIEVVDQRTIDERLQRLDHTGNKSHVGANAILAVSVAACRAGASYLGIPLYAHLGGSKESLLPVPMLNIINGGVHAPNQLDFQEYMIVPAGLPSFSEAIRCACEVYRSCRELLKERKLRTTVGDEGGFAPDFSSNKEPLQLLVEAIREAGYIPGKHVFLALDPAASGLCEDGAYHLRVEGRALKSRELVDMYVQWVEEYPIVSIEDGLAEEDWEGWQYLTGQLGTRLQVVGDDIFVTSSKLLKQGIDLGVANAVLVKPNQVGTVTETLECVELARSHGYQVVISHRSGETEDTFIADLAVATSAGQIKAGAPCRGERTAKYNQLIRIEQETGGRFAGMKVYGRTEG